MPKLFMLLLGCTPKGRNIEQHDIFFGIGENIKELIPQILAFWPEANGKIHIDAWREINTENGFSVSVIEKVAGDNLNKAKLFFINLGGYKKNEFEEFHYKMIIAATDKAAAITQAKETAFYKHTGFDNAHSHIDDKFGVDVDDLFEIEDILSEEIKNQYRLSLHPVDQEMKPDEIHLGYFKLSSFK